MSDKNYVILKNVRLTFVHLHQPQPGKPEHIAAAQAQGREYVPKYQTGILIEKDTEQGKKNIAVLDAIMKKCGNEKWPDGIPGACIFALHDGATKDHLDGYDGSVMCCNASNRIKPTLVDSDGKTLLEPNDGKALAGDYANVRVSPWAQDNSNGKRINLNIEAVQFLRRGERFGLAPVAPEATGFGDESTEADPEEVSKYLED